MSEHFGWLIQRQQAPQCHEATFRQSGELLSGTERYGLGGALEHVARVPWLLELRGGKHLLNACL